MSISVSRLILFCAVALTTSSAIAQTQCTFATECFEGETCADTEFNIKYTLSYCPRAPGPRYISVETDFGELNGREIGSACTSRLSDIVHDGGEYVLTGDGATYLLSIEDGNARLTTHVEGPTSITYMGQCEAPQ